MQLIDSNEILIVREYMLLCILVFIYNSPSLYYSLKFLFKREKNLDTILFYERFLFGCVVTLKTFRNQSKASDLVVLVA